MEGDASASFERISIVDSTTRYVDSVIVRNRLTCHNLGFQVVTPLVSSLIYIPVYDAVESVERRLCCLLHAGFLRGLLTLRS